MWKAARILLKIIWWSTLLLGAVVTLALFVVEGYIFLMILAAVLGE